MGGLVMVGKWYKYIGPEDEYFTTDKWYLCYELGENGNLHFIDNANNKEQLNWFTFGGIDENIDLSNPMDYNPDEVKEETKPQLRVETITIVVYPDGKYEATSPLSNKEVLKHLKEAAYLLDKQINED